MGHGLIEPRRQLVHDPGRDLAPAGDPLTDLVRGEPYGGIPVRAGPTRQRLEGANGGRVAGRRAAHDLGERRVLGIRQHQLLARRRLDGQRRRRQPAAEDQLEPVEAVVVEHDTRLPAEVGLVGRGRHGALVS